MLKTFRVLLVTTRHVQTLGGINCWTPVAVSTQVLTVSDHSDLSVRELALKELRETIAKQMFGRNDLTIEVVVLNHS
jgi:hypothetical protein